MSFKYAIENLIIFIVLMLLQVTVFNNVNVYGMGFPMIYAAIILMLPVLQPAWFVLLASFLTGLTLDFFSDTGGIHAAAITLMGFVRIFVLNRLEPQAGYAKDDRPGLAAFRPQWLLIYLSILILVHHLFYFTLEEGSLARAGGILLKSIVSGILSLMVILVLNIFLIRK